MSEVPSRQWVLMITELRRVPQMGYKSDIVVLSGLDDGDKQAIDQAFKKIDAPCQLDNEDGRFVLKNPGFNPMEVINALTTRRGYRIEYNPAQHNIPLKQGNVDDKFAIVYHLSKEAEGKTNISREDPDRSRESIVKQINEVDLAKK